MIGITDKEFCVRFIEDVFKSAIMDMEKNRWKMIGENLKKTKNI